MNNLNFDETKLLLGKLLAQQVKDHDDLLDAEFKVFSQFGDDGIIQYLINKIKPLASFFVEFGVEDYLESNTRFLLQNNNWSGLVIDGNPNNVTAINNHYFFWKHDLTAVHAFISAENINQILEKHLPVSDIGILHIDIDGMDYWVWKAIHFISPPIVIIEYNSIFGKDRPITVPYSADFVRTRHHYSNLYAGSSLLSLCDLAEAKGYYFVGSNSAGNNAYFVKKNFIGNVKILSAEEGYVESKFRESRDQKGNLTYVRSHQRVGLIRGMKVFNTRTNQIEQL